MRRRHLLLGSLLLPPATAVAQAQDWGRWLDGVRAQARREGIGPTGLRALDGLKPNQRVITLDRRQPEGTITWERYRETRVSETRIRNGRQAMAENAAILAAISQRYVVQPRYIVGIWGMETAYGFVTGDFPVIEALATLAWEGRRAAFFRAELFAALKILDRGDITPARMKGSYAGAMGQGQFMPTSFLGLAVDFDGDGRRDIWDSKPDALASIAHYLKRRGTWRAGESWGFEVQPTAVAASENPRAARPMADWRAAGLRTLSGAALPDAPPAALVKVGQAAFLVHHNFNAFRAYNPSNFYALAVGLLGDAVA
jgi:membrane-bound lytic murein transglycosylase B